MCVYHDAFSDSPVCASGLESFSVFKCFWDCVQIYFGLNFTVLMKRPVETLENRTVEASPGEDTRTEPNSGKLMAMRLTVY